jgi:Tfp pilus assembly protein PilF
MSWFEARLRAGEYTRLALKKPTAIAYADSAYMYLYRRQYQEAIAEAERGLALEPNNPICLRAMGWVLIWAGKPKEGIEYLNKWIRVDPRDRPEYLKFLSCAHLYMGEIAEAAHLLEQGLKLNPEEVGGMDILAACYSLLGRDQDARAMLDLRRKKSAAVPTTMWGNMFVAPFKDRAVADRYAEGLIKAGFPPVQIAGGYYPAFKENQLTGAEIKKLFFGSKVTGIDVISGQPWWVDRKKNGEFTWRGPGPIPSDTGRSRIEGDMVCTQYQKRLWGLEYCMTVFRNPGGKHESKDEYFYCSDIGFVPFSLVK